MASASTERDPLLPRYDKDTPIANGSVTTSSNSSIKSSSTTSVVDELHGRELYLALLFPILGLFLVSMDVTLTTTIAATVASNFSSLSLISWLGSAYLVAMTVVQSVSGSLTDRYGRRMGFFFGIVFFAIGNLICGIATDSGTLIAARAVAGAGGGAINSVTTFLFSDLVSMRRRPMWQGLGQVAWAVGMGMGGIFGGLINDWFGWRWAFLALTPMTILVGVGAFFTFVRGLPRARDDDDNKSSQKIDWLGSAMLACTLICFVLGLNLAKGSDASSSTNPPTNIDATTNTTTLITTLLALAAAFLTAFILIEKYHATNPVIPLHLLTSTLSVPCASLAGFFLAASFHSLLFYVPTLLQAQGHTTSSVGLQMLGEPAGAGVGPFLVGLAIRELGSYALLKPIAWGIYVIAPAMVYFAGGLETPSWITFVALMAMGAGFGSVVTVNLTALLANVDTAMQAKSTAMAYVFRQSGASVGLALAGLIFRAGLTPSITHTTTTTSATPPLHPTSLSISNGIAEQCALPRSNLTILLTRPAICTAYATALHQVFLFTLITGIVGFALGMLVRNQDLERESRKWREVRVNVRRMSIGAEN